MRKLRPKAFTLVEVLGSMVILTGAVVGVILCSADGLAATKNIERKVKSILLAESEVERIKCSLLQDFNQSYVGNHVNLGGSYLSRNSLKDVSGRPELKEVEVSVGYDINSNVNLGGDEIIFTLVTRVVEK